MSLDRARVEGHIFFCDGFTAAGEVRLLSSIIRGDLNCDGGVFNNENSDALSFDRTQVGGSVFLSGRFVSKGSVSLVGSTISGNLEVNHAELDNINGYAIVCRRANIVGSFIFRDVKAKGNIDLAGLRVEMLDDDPNIWGKDGCRTVLDGFKFSRIGGSPCFTKAALRVQWLDGQILDHLKEEFRPQPWEHMVSTLRAMGHPNEARRVAIQKQQRERTAGRVRGMSRLFHWLYGRLVGYGYFPARLLGVMIAVWLGCAIVYEIASSPGTDQRMPTHSIFQNSETSFSKGPNYTNRANGGFDAIYFSLDALLPIDLGYQSTWRVKTDLTGGYVIQWMIGLQVVFGWLSSLLLIGVLGNLIKKD